MGRRLPKPLLFVGAALVLAAGGLMLHDLAVLGVVKIQVDAGEFGSPVEPGRVASLSRTVRWPVGPVRRTAGSLLILSSAPEVNAVLADRAMKTRDPRLWATVFGELATRDEAEARRVATERTGFAEDHAAHDDARVRAAALRALNLCPSTPALAFIEPLEDPEPVVRQAAAMGLQARASAEHLATLSERVSAEPHGLTLQALAGAVARVSEPGARALYARLVQRAVDESLVPGGPGPLMTILVDSPAPWARGLLLELARTPSEAQDNAIQALKGAPMDAEIAELCRAVLASDPYMAPKARAACRQVVGEALGVPSERTADVLSALEDWASRGGQ